MVASRVFWLAALTAASVACPAAVLAQTARDGALPINSLLRDPPWSKAPSQAQVLAAWPKGAERIQTAQVVLRCDVTREGTLQGCDVLSEAPGNKGFGKAAKSLAKAFQVTYAPDEAAKLRTLTVDVPIRLRNPDAPDARKLPKPRWIDVLSPDGEAAVFPAAALKAGVRKGKGAAACVISAEGRLKGCQAVRENPAGLDFGAAAVRAASVLRMNPWTKDGDAVEGLKITVPFAFAMTGDKARVQGGQ